MLCVVRECAETSVNPALLQKGGLIEGRMRWPGHAARMGERIGAYTIWWGKHIFFFFFFNRRYNPWWVLGLLYSREWNPIPTVQEAG